MRIIVQQPLCVHELGSRRNQEDWIYPECGHATSKDRLFIVCDGMGGHEKGEVASQTAGDAIVSYISEHYHQEYVMKDTIINEAINYALDHLDAIDTESGIRKMGTTLALVCFHKGGCVMAHIGDSRIYHIRPREHRIIYKSRDHSLAYDLLQAGEISLKELRSYPKKNVISSAMMPNMEERPVASIAHSTNIEADDYFFLCSDGMLEGMTDNQVLDILCSNFSEEEKRNILINSTSQNQDNHSAYLIRISNINQDEDDENLFNDEDDVKSNAIILEKKLYKRVGNEALSSVRLSSSTKIFIFILMLIIILVFYLRIFT